MKKIIANIFSLILQVYIAFYLSLFITDYSFIFKRSISNISGFTFLLAFLLLLRWTIDKDSFQSLTVIQTIKKIASLKDKVILFIIFLSITFMLSILGIVRHLSLSTMASDMGIFDQAVWNTLNGDILFSSIRGNFSLLGDHFEPILLSMAPLYAVFPHVFTLVITQAIILAASIYPLYWIAKERSQDRFIIFAFIISFALSKSLRGIGLSDFHLEAFMVPLSLFAFYFLTRERYGLFFLMLFLILTTKESAVFITAAFGFYLLFPLKKRKLGITLVCVSILALIFETKFLIPLFNKSREYLYYNKLPFGDSFYDNIKVIFLRPGEVLKFVFDQQRTGYIIKLLTPLAFLPLIALRQYPLLILPLIPICLGPANSYSNITSHYGGHILAFIYIAAIYGLENLLKLFSSPHPLPSPQRGEGWGEGKSRIYFYFSILIIFLSLLSYGKTDAYKFKKFINGIKDNHAQEKLSYLSIIPKCASVSATSNLIPHMSHRKYIYTWDPLIEISLNTEYIIIDMDAIGYLSNESKNKIPACLKNIAASGYQKIFFNNNENFLVFHNPYNNKSMIENFYDGKLNM